jgi:hypothetical protein
MHFSMLSVVLCVVMASAAAAVAAYCWRAARRRRGHRRDWERLAPELRDLDEDLDRMWRMEEGHSGRHR